MAGVFSHQGHLVESAVEIPFNEWSHLAITFDGSSVRLYVNGALAGMARSNPVIFVYGPLEYDPAAVPVTIGADWKIPLNDPDPASHVISSPFHGRIDEVSLYNRALTADEILAIWNADFVGKDFSRPYFTSSAQLPDGVLGSPYSQQVATVVSASPVNFSLSAGALPRLHLRMRRSSTSWRNAPPCSSWPQF